MSYFDEEWEKPLVNANQKQTLNFLCTPNNGINIKELTDKQNDNKVTNETIKSHPDNNPT